MASRSGGISEATTAAMRAGPIAKRRASARARSEHASAARDASAGFSGPWLASRALCHRRRRSSTSGSASSTRTYGRSASRCAQVPSALVAIATGAGASISACASGRAWAARSMCPASAGLSSSITICAHASRAASSAPRTHAMSRSAASADTGTRSDARSCMCAQCSAAAMRSHESSPTSNATRTFDACMSASRVAALTCAAVSGVSQWRFGAQRGSASGWPVSACATSGVRTKPCCSEERGVASSSHSSAPLAVSGAQRANQRRCAGAPARAPDKRRSARSVVRCLRATSLFR
ncbi:hypothetical protein AWB81_05835 [Caballeronia arationis]|nr:hypothetical protein AWB81_05835 [Caballeronia arationis]